MVTITHTKVNAMTNWTQAQLAAQIALGNFPVGTTLAQITLPSDWNAVHTISDLAIADVSGLQPALDAKYDASNPAGYISSVAVDGVTVFGDGAGVPLYAQERIVALTHDYPATLADINTIFTNEGASQDVVIDLPDASPLAYFKARNARDGFYIGFRVTGSATLYTNGTILAAGTRLLSNQIGDELLISSAVASAWSTPVLSGRWETS